MALGDITNKIAADAKEQIAQIERETATTIAQIEANAKVKLTAEKQFLASKLDTTIANAQKVALSRARRSAVGIIDQMRREMIDQVFAQSLKYLVDLDENSYQQWIGALVDSVSPSERTTITQISAPANRIVVTEQVCAKAGLNVTVIASDDIVAGLRLESEQIAYDLTAQRLLGDMRSELEPVIAGKLFT